MDLSKNKIDELAANLAAYVRRGKSVADYIRDERIERKYRDQIIVKASKILKAGGGWSEGDRNRKKIQG